jgi:hypothetical protein
MRSQTIVHIASVKRTGSHLSIMWNQTSSRPVTLGIPTGSCLAIYYFPIFHDVSQLVAFVVEFSRGNDI